MVTVTTLTTGVLTAFHLSGAELDDIGKNNAPAINAFTIGTHLSNLGNEIIAAAPSNIWDFTIANAGELYKNHAKTINQGRIVAELLPHVQNFLASGETGQGIPDLENHIHTLQLALGMKRHSGVFDKATADALLAYEIDGLNYGFAGGHYFDLEDYPDILKQVQQSDKFEHAHDLRIQVEINRALTAELENAIAQNNALTIDQFEECVERTFSDEGQNLLSRITKDITSSSDPLLEEGKAQWRIYSAIGGACNKYFNQIPHSEQERQVTNIIKKLEPQINASITEAVEQANKPSLGSKMLQEIGSIPGRISDAFNQMRNGEHRVH